jgi:hypothetical protein
MKPTHLLRNVFRAVVALVAIFVSNVLWAQPQPAVLSLDHVKVKAVKVVQQKVTADLMLLPDILGTAVGVDSADEPLLVVYVDQEGKGASDIVRSMPPKMRGVAVRVELTDKFRPFKGERGGGGVSHTAKQTPAIQLGTSGSWRNDLANGYCCGGTLGSIIQVNGVQYVLSNFHVFESDIVSGGNGIVAQTGDNVIQPGLIDVGCVANNAQNVATLVKINSLPNSNVDASVARVIPGMVRTDGAILEIGTLSSNTVAAVLKKPVKKSGRTTGLTRSSISGLNATIRVAYDNECAGGIAFIKTFTGQIVVANKGNKFLNGGDSGSLMVEDATTNPRAIGLFYAGSSSTAIANPIGEVLQYVGSQLGGTAAMVGK